MWFYRLYFSIISQRFSRLCPCVSVNLFLDFQLMKTKIYWEYCCHYAAEWFITFACWVVDYMTSIASITLHKRFTFWSMSYGAASKRVPFKHIFFLFIFNKIIDLISWQEFEHRMERTGFFWKHKKKSWLWWQKYVNDNFVFAFSHYRKTESQRDCCYCWILERFRT